MATPAAEPLLTPARGVTASHGVPVTTSVEARQASSPPYTELPPTALALNGPPPAASSLPVIEAVAPAPVSDAAQLFARANDARRAGDHERAVSLYRRLMDEYASSAEAHESQAALGRVLLEDGDAPAALQVFDGYLRIGGPLREDVMAERALALGRLGRTRDEADAWSSLLEAYPGSVHQARARARLRELGAP
jgi:TolA-binding protein